MRAPRGQAKETSNPKWCQIAHQRQPLWNIVLMFPTESFTIRRILRSGSDLISKFGVKPIYTPVNVKSQTKHVSNGNIRTELANLHSELDSLRWRFFPLLDGSSGLSATLGVDVLSCFLPPSMSIVYPLWTRRAGLHETCQAPANFDTGWIELSLKCPKVLHWGQGICRASRAAFDPQESLVVLIIKQIPKLSLYMFYRKLILNCLFYRCQHDVIICNLMFSGKSGCFGYSWRVVRLIPSGILDQDRILKLDDACSVQPRGIFVPSKNKQETLRHCTWNHFDAFSPCEYAQS